MPFNSFCCKPFCFALKIIKYLSNDYHYLIINLMRSVKKAFYVQGQSVFELIMKLLPMEFWSFITKWNYENNLIYVKIFQTVNPETSGTLRRSCECLWRRLKFPGKATWTYGPIICRVCRDRLNSVWKKYLFWIVGK